MARQRFNILDTVGVATYDDSDPEMTAFIWTMIQQLIKSCLWGVRMKLLPYQLMIYEQDNAKSEATWEIRIGQAGRDWLNFSNLKELHELKSKQRKVFSIQENYNAVNQEKPEHNYGGRIVVGLLIDCPGTEQMTEDWRERMTELGLNTVWAVLGEYKRRIHEYYGRDWRTFYLDDIKVEPETSVLRQDD